MLSEHSNLCYVLKPLDFEILKLHYKLLLREERNDLIYGENKSGVTVNSSWGAWGNSAWTPCYCRGSAFSSGLPGICKASELYPLYPSLVSQQAAGGPLSAQHTNIHFILGFFLVMWSHWYSSEAKFKHALCALDWIWDQGQNSFFCQLWTKQFLVRKKTSNKN